MSLALRQAVKDTSRIKYSLPEYKPIFRSMVNHLQVQGCASNAQDGVTGASTLSTGQSVIFEVNFNSKDIEKDYAYWIKGKLVSTDTTNTATFPTIFSIFDSLVFEINDGSQKLEFSQLNFIRDIIGDYLKEFNREEVYEELSKFKLGALTNFAGDSIVSGTTITFYYPITPFINFIENQVPNFYLKKLKLTCRMTPAVSNASDCFDIATSDTANNAYTKAKVTMEDLQFIRTYTILNDKRLQIKPMISGNTLVLLPDYEETTISTSWTNVGTDKQSVLLSDLGKRSDIQKVTAYVTPVPGDFSEATGIHYSGSKYILWKLRQLGNDKKVLDFTENAHFQRMYEIFGHKARYGKQLPQEVYNQTGDGVNLMKYYLHLTNIYFDSVYNKIEENHEEMVNTLDSTKDDYEITFVCNGSVGASCVLHILLMRYKMYNWNPSTYQLQEVLDF